MQFTACLIATSLMVVGAVIFVLYIWASWQRFIGNVPEHTRSASGSRNSGQAVYYRSTNGRSDYNFWINRMEDGDYRIYVRDHPSYGSRDTGDVATHRLRDSHGAYICFTGRITTMEQARSLAATWADKTESYILHGKRF